MLTEIIIPIMDQSGGDVTLAKWLKREGAVVHMGDGLCEIETSKASIEIPADVDGILRKILISEGTAIPSLTVIALMGDATEPLPTIDPYYRVKRPPPRPFSAKNVGEGAAPHLPPRTSTAERTGGIVASPRAKRLAVEHNIDLATVVGTGPDGRIVEDDVRRAIAERR